MADETKHIGILAVDLDGTLLRSDMLYECLWDALARDPFAGLRAVRALKQGKPALKRQLAEDGAPDIARLPYNQTVIAHIRAWREAGGRTALVTATDQPLAEEIAAYLDLFDEVHGTTPERNLKGTAKAQFLVECYGEGGFTYMGDSEADLAVWPHGAAGVSVEAGRTMRAKAEAANPEMTHLSPPEPAWKPILKAMRPHQWLKNTLVFVPVVASQLFNGENFFYALMAFISFGLVASSGYLLNDLLDLNADRAHARKCHRPLASGRLSAARGTQIFPLLLGAGLLIAAMLGGKTFLAILFYFIMTMGYSLWLKRQVLLDICVLAGLYTLRIVVGGFATDITLSIWLLAFSMFFFFSLACVKRQAELVDLEARGRSKAKGRGYKREDLQIVSQMATSSGLVSVLVLALYLNAQIVNQRYSMPELLWADCVLLLFWITRMVFVTHRGLMNDDPLIYAVTDRTSQLVFSAMAIVTFGAVVL